jgi:hypothetical protein
MNNQAYRHRACSPGRAARKRKAEPPQKDPIMTPTEFAAACESVYGPWWRSALARAINRSLRLIHYYEHGDRRIPPGVAAQIRGLADIGLAGITIRNAVKKAAPDIHVSVAHRIARQALADLLAAGLLQQRGLGANSRYGDGKTASTRAG